MPRIGRMRRLRAGAEMEYDRYHCDVWPDVLQAIRRAGITRYTIFRCERWLFSYFELADGYSLDLVSKVFLADGACQRWEALIESMCEAMPGRADAGWVELQEVFHVDGFDADSE